MPETTEYNLGDIVLCDLCNADYSTSDAIGGFVFSAKAVCPECAPRMWDSLIQYDEVHLVETQPAKGETFAEMVRRYRGGPATMTITTWD